MVDDARGPGIEVVDRVVAPPVLQQPFLVKGATCTQYTSVYIVDTLSH